MSACRFGHCPGGNACYCEMERQAHDDVRNSMRMLTFAMLYAVGMVGLIAAICMLTT